MHSLTPLPELEKRIWTVPGFASIELEVAIWLSWSLQQFGPGLTATIVVMDNDWGDWWLRAVEARIAELALDIEPTVVRHDPAAQDLDDVLVAVAATPPNVILAATAGNPCLLLANDSDAHAELAGGAGAAPVGLSKPPGSVGRGGNGGAGGAVAHTVDVVGVEFFLVTDRVVGRRELPAAGGVAV